jgi:hypothetical protein
MGRGLMRLRAEGWKLGLAAADAVHWALSEANVELRRPEEAAGAIIEADAWPCRALRIGLVNPGRWADLLVDAAGGCEVDWFSMPEGEHVATACERHMLDVVIAPSEGGLELLSLERPGHDAGWYDWSIVRPMSYAQVFPMRIDCARLPLEMLERPERAGLVRAIVEAAAVLSRVPGRLTLEDRLEGRAPATQAKKAATRFGPYRQTRDGIGLAMQRLTEVLVARREGAEVSAMERMCARACGAWLATWDGEMPASERRVRMEQIARITGDEPDTMLRLAAARFGAFDDKGGMEALVRADAMLQDAALMPNMDHMVFIHAELQMGSLSGMAIGRVAAGLGLVCATVDRRKLGFFAEDLAEELNHSRLLVGRDQDRALLLSIFREIEGSRPAARVGVPRKAA